LQELATFKTSEEKGAIADAIKASVMFRNVTDGQRELIYSCMESIKVEAGTWVIRQGTVGDRFYIVDDGLFEVRIVPDGEEDLTGEGGHIVHQYEGSRARHAHPSFGELALMHSAPRSASIVAKTDGHLWALHRAAFRQILVQAQDHRKDLKKVLREIPHFGKLDSDGINKLAALMEDITFGRGDNMTEQGMPGEKLFVVESGSGYSTEILGGETKRSNVKAGAYFGDELLSTSTGRGTYAKTVMALQTTTCWQLDVPLLKQTMGPLLQGGGEDAS
jgi:cAMP-dependent protein kinase regulator